MTPLQKKVNELMAAFEKAHGKKLSGRELSGMLGKSRNHLSQIMNDGLVPSGEVLIKLGHVLEADEADQRDLVLAAMRTKAGGRARDTFWLQRALELTDALIKSIAQYRAFLEKDGRLDEFDRWMRQLDPPESSDGVQSRSTDGSA